MSRYKRLKKKAIKLNRKQHQPGLPPGSLIYLGEQREADIKVKQIEYAENLFR